MEHVDLLLAGVERDRMRILARFVIDPDRVLVALHDPLHIALLRLTVPRARNHIPGALPVARVIGLLGRTSISREERHTNHESKIHIAHGTDLRAKMNSKRATKKH